MDIGRAVRKGALNLWRLSRRDAEVGERTRLQIANGSAYRLPGDDPPAYRNLVPSRRPGRRSLYRTRPGPVIWERDSASRKMGPFQRWGSSTVPADGARSSALAVRERAAARRR